VDAGDTFTSRSESPSKGHKLMSLAPRQTQTQGEKMMYRIDIVDQKPYIDVYFKISSQKELDEVLQRLKIAKQMLIILLENRH